MAGILKTLSSFHNRFLNKCNSKMTFLNIQNPTRTLTSETQNKLTELNIPEKPKKPLSPYLQFIREIRASVVKENPDSSPNDIIKKCAEKWKASSELEKEKYIYKFKSDSEAYNDDILRYNASLTQEQLLALQVMDRENMMEKQSKRVRKLNKQFNKPRKPMNAYLLFLKDRGQIQNLTGKTLIANLSGEWHKLPNSEKQKYEEKYSKEQENYEKELLEWEKKMFAEGHEELIRPKYLKIWQKEQLKQIEHSSKISKAKKGSE
ncbi:mitochondrial transcription factor A [Leptinotarsa decemlineata]|uniref:mitochondrial transcription factor A n=1 Tax=Leptinotarsa decemlineata TaxID=7539 RepID=UPI003D307A18